MENQTIVVSGLTNREFLEKFMHPGRVGLCGGVTNIDKAICHAQRHLSEDRRLSDWSHVFFFQGLRADGHHWVIESDIQIHRKHIQLGVQENRVAKFFDDDFYTTLAVLDFGLNDEQVALIIREGLELVASHERYSVRELVGTLITLRRPELRARENMLARENSVYCSAFVKGLFLKAGIELVPGIAAKNTTPEEIFRTLVPHKKYVLQREMKPGKLKALHTKLNRQVKEGIKKLKRS